MAEQKGDRIYVGGLSQDTSGQCIANLLRPFGEVCDVDVNARGFAHVSLKCTSSTTDRCITALNRTMWRDNVLRLERGKQHYIQRLRDERHIPTTENENDVPMNDKETKPVNFEWKGKHIIFDHNEDDDVDEVFLDDVDGDNTEQKLDVSHDMEASVEKGPQSVANENIENKHAFGDDDTTKDKVGNWEQKKTTKTVQSTLSLFGLSSVNQSEHLSPQTKKRKDPPKSNSPAETKPGKEQQRNKQPESKPKRPCQMNFQRADAIGNDSSLIDLNLERNAALSILSSLFPDKSDLPNSQPASHNEKHNSTQSTSLSRRAGLYKCLVQLAKGCEPDGKNKKEAAKSGKGLKPLVLKKKNSNKKGNKKTKVRSMISSSLSKSGNVISIKQTSVSQIANNSETTGFIRRKGLYKKLS